MPDCKRVIALGFFDGVHIGHAALLRRTAQRAAALGVRAAALSFALHPDALVRGERVALLSSPADRAALVREIGGVDELIPLSFDKKMMQTPWRDFIEKLRRDKGAVCFVAGRDFLFGRGGEGTAESLCAYAAAQGFGCEIVEPVCLDGEIVSSTRIRALIEQGEMERAVRLLGHPHLLSDTVRAGKHLGTALGAPTVNMALPEGVICPRRGVYATRVTLSDGTDCAAVTNVGVRPSVDTDGAVTVETHLLDVRRELYGERLRLGFYSYLREERKFDSLAALSAQIGRDAAAARAYFGEKP